MAEAIYSTEEISSASGRGQKIDALYPLRAKKDDLSWECSECRRLESYGFGCVDCLGFVCHACTTKGRHRCGRPDGGKTLDGLELGVSRERARQILEKVLGKLRYRAKLARPRWDNEEDALFERKDLPRPSPKLSLLDGAIVHDSKSGLTDRAIAKRYGLSLDQVGTALFRWKIRKNTKAPEPRLRG